MKRLNPNKLHVEYRRGILPAWPIIPRKYTLTHSDLTGDLFLAIGSQYATDKITEMRDEVLGEWIPYGADDVALFINVHVDGKGDAAVSSIRNNVFIQELPLALEGIIYGDKALLNTYPALNNSPVFVQFNSRFPQFNRIEYWGLVHDYR